MVAAASPSPITIALPSWVPSLIGERTHFATDDDRMALAIALSRENVARGTGGPFGAAVFDDATGRLLAIGTNSVRRLGNCVLHAEVMALMFALHAAGTHAFDRATRPAIMLATSCDPCAMCLGAVLWSGVRRVVCGATREDALAIGFDEGPVFPESLQYLADRGVSFTHGVQREAARAVLHDFVAAGNPLY
jgi:tRNA(Arg) A34 adenosine deaminase TadA